MLAGTCIEVVEHLPADGIPRYLAELRRLLAPGGRLLLTTPNYRSYWPVLEYLIDHLGGAAQMGGAQHITRFHPRSLRAALEDNGFRVLRSGSLYHLSPFVSALAPRFAERLFAWETRRKGAQSIVATGERRSLPHDGRAPAARHRDLSDTFAPRARGQ